MMKYAPNNHKTTFQLDIQHFTSSHIYMVCYNQEASCKHFINQIVYWFLCMDQVSLVSRLRFLLVMKLVVGSLLSLYIDLVLGLVVLFAGLVTLGWVVYASTHTLDASRALSWFHLTIGAVLLLSVVLLVALGDSHVLRLTIKTSVGSLLVGLSVWRLR